MASEAKRAADSRMEWILESLRQGVARACPPELASDREDLVQAAALRVLEWERAGEENRLPSPSYARRLAFNVVIDELRKTRPLPTDLSGRMESVGSVASPELVVGLRECLEQLVGPRRVAVFLHLQGFSGEEVGRALRSEVKRAYNLVHRGLGDLRRCLASKGLAP